MLPTEPTASAHSASIDPGLLPLVLVEDDDGDAFLVRELLDEAHLPTSLSRVRSLSETLIVLDASASCVLLDLALPDASGLEALHAVLKAAPQAAVIVLTGYADEHRGIEAVAAGAQDYLVKGEVSGQLLARAIRFAIERKRAEESVRRLREAEHFAAENARLERGLLPQPLITSSRLAFVKHYRPGRRRALLGGDFYDLVEKDDGRTFAVVGDVSGHGPDGAAMGVNLRIAWRTLVLAGTAPERILPTLNEIIGRERRNDTLFATVCMAVIAPDQASTQLFLAGHPAPICLRPNAKPAQKVLQLPEEPHGPVLGLLPQAQWPGVTVPLLPMWSLMLFTDGLFEGRIGDGPQRLGEEGLMELIKQRQPPHPVPPAWPNEIITAVEELNNGEGLADDVALLILSQTKSGPDQ